MESKQRNKGRGRGVLALTSYEPCPRPSAATIGSWHRPINKAIGVEGKQINNNTTSRINCATTSVNNYVKGTRTNGNVENNLNRNDVANDGYREMNGHCENPKANSNFKNQDIRNTMVNGNNQTINGHHSLHQEKSEAPKTDVCMINAAEGGVLAKYNYKANPDRPGGFAELTVKQGEKLKLIRKGHEETRNPLWWEVKNEQGEQGFVPGTYCMILEETPTALPWLENKRLIEEKDEKKREAERVAKDDTGFGNPDKGAPRIKEYQSAYTNNNNIPQPKNKAEASKEFYCEVCDKNLNGPQPYKMHMSSKAHREEVEYQRSKDQYN